MSVCCAEIEKETSVPNRSAFRRKGAEKNHVTSKYTVACHTIFVTTAVTPDMTSPKDRRICNDPSVSQYKFMMWVLAYHPSLRRISHNHPSFLPPQICYQHFGLPQNPHRQVQVRGRTGLSACSADQVEQALQSQDLLTQLQDQNLSQETVQHLFSMTRLSQMHRFSCV